MSLPLPHQPSAAPHRGVAHAASALTVVLLAFLTWVATAVPAHAAATTVGNGLSTTDLAQPGMSPAALASALVGPGVTVSNVTYTGAPAQAGLIHLVDPAVVSFNDGVILSTGNIADVVGPNKSDSTTGDMAGAADADLTGLIVGTQTVNPVTFDAASLELDFVPTASQVYFTYTFASDEYLEWVNLFNDVFAFYVNGQNCATLPDGQAVSIDTINSAVHPDKFRDNSFTSPPANPINIESDGLSVELICQAPVVAGQVNHMKLAIADTSDQILDSVVMIKAHSLSTTKPESCNDGSDNDDDGLVDDSDDSCSTTTTPPPTGSSGVGSSGSAPAFTGNEGSPIVLDASVLGWAATPDTVATSWTVHGINGTTGTCDVTPAGPQPLNPDGSIAVVTAVCPDDGEYVASVNGADAEGSSAFDMDVDFFVHNAPPAVSISSPAPGSSAPAGSPVVVNASVVDPGASDVVTCSISWGDGTEAPGALVGGMCTGSHAYAADGSYIVSVTATDDAGDSAADASLVTISGTAAPTLTSNVNPAVKGQPVKLTAVTTPGATGTMSFYDGSSLLGTRTVTSGKAALTTEGLSVGTHAITAVHEVAPGAPTSVSAVLVQEVLPAATTTTLTSSANPSVTGQPVVLKAVVKAVAPGKGTANGTISFYGDGILIATKPTALGAAALKVKPSVGNHSYTATYNGSSSYLASTAYPVAQQVTAAGTTTALTSSANPSLPGQTVTLKATVKAVAPGAGTPTGTVQLYDDGVLVATKALLTGSASFAVVPAVGPHSYTVTYSGSTAYLPSSLATPLAQVVS